MMITYDSTWVCNDPNCLDYVPMEGCSMQPDSPPLVILGECPGCGQQYQFGLGPAGEVITTEI